jgi:hypothetical protein
MIAAVSLFQRFGAMACPVCPGRRNKRSAAIGQNRQQQRHTAPLQAADNSKAASFEGMPPAGDDYRCRKVLMMGSLWYFRLTTSTTNFCSRLSGNT